MKERGTYQTKQREAVYALFAMEPALCLTAEEIHLRLCASGLDVGKTTVYRALTKLCGEGKLRKYAPQESGEAARYAWNPCQEKHLHIRCVACGTLAHLGCDTAGAFCRHIASHHGFSLIEEQTVLSGLCDKCEQRKGDKER